MTFKYGLTLPVSGGHKIKRFRQWANSTLPDLEFRLPPQAPIETNSLTIRLRSVEDRARILEALPGAIP